MMIPQLPNNRWSVDFVADQFIDGRHLRILVVDDCTASAWLWSPTPRCPAPGSLANSIGCSSSMGSPKMIVSDNGTELTSNAMLRWADDHKVA